MNPSSRRYAQARYAMRPLPLRALLFLVPVALFGCSRAENFKLVNDSRSGVIVQVRAERIRVPANSEVKSPHPMYLAGNLQIEIYDAYGKKLEDKNIELAGDSEFRSDPTIDVTP